MISKKHIPNLLTLFRVMAAPVALVIAAAHPQQRELMFALFAAASVTDFFDGYLARKWHAQSKVGTMLDPIADKLLVATVLLYLMEYTSAPIAAIGIILMREIYIAGLREYLALQNIALPVSKGGKWKTALQLIAITLLLAALAFPTPYVIAFGVALSTWNVGIILLWASALLALTSAVSYTRSAMKSF